MGIGAWARGETKKRGRLFIGDTAWLGATADVATGRYLRKDDALTVGAVYRGINALANPIAIFPLYLYKRGKGNSRERATDHRLYPLLLRKPNSIQSAFDFKHLAITHLIIHGNFYAQIQMDLGRNVLSLWPLQPTAVTPKLINKLGTNYFEYEISRSDGTKTKLSQDEVLHVRGFSLDGINGVSPLTYGMRTVGSAIAQEEQTASLFGRGIKASGILKHPANLSAEAAKNLKRSFESQHGGSSNAGGVIVLEEGLDWINTQITPEQAQAIESKKYTVTECAQWLGIPPHKLYGGDKLTYANYEQSNQDFLADSIDPLATKIEACIDTQLLDIGLEQDRYFSEFLRDARLATDLKTRYDAYAVARMNGWMNVNEIRARENLNPLDGDSGEIYLEPLNMVPAGSNRDQPTSGTDAPNTTPGAPNANPRSLDLLEAFKPAIQDLMMRTVRREMEMRKRPSFTKAKITDGLTRDLLPLVTSICRASSIDTTGTIQKTIVEDLGVHYMLLSDAMLNDLNRWEEIRGVAETEYLMQKIGEIAKH